ncbi:MAG TPA: glucuronate isomerase [Microlunatus sp.]|nr:glucuronate isomerase [Microlunatus sp.]
MTPGEPIAGPGGSQARDLADALFASIAERPVVSIHNGLPARYLAEDLPITDPVNLLIAHDQGVQALLRAHDVRLDPSPAADWKTRESRCAFALLWNHLVAVRARPWMEQDGDHIAELAGLPPFRAGQDPDVVYDRLAAQLAERPVHPRRALAGTGVARLATSDDPTDDLHAHAVLRQDPAWAGRVIPTFSPDRYLEPGRRGWRTDAELLAETTDIETGDLDGFLGALRRRREYFINHGTVVSEHHVSDVGVARLAEREAAELYRLAVRAELLPEEALALQRHLLWELGAMSAEGDGLVMALYPPAGFHADSRAATDDHGVAARIRPLLDDFGSRPGFRLWLFAIDLDAYLDEILPLAGDHPALTAVPPTRFADDPADLRAVRITAVRAIGAGRVLGMVDDMSGPFALAERHRLGRRLDAGALAQLVAEGHLDEDQAYLELSAALDRSLLPRPRGV